jgi:hypothetical protein
MVARDLEPQYIPYAETLSQSGTAYDPTDSTSKEFTAAGAKRRTTVIEESPLAGGPSWKNGKRTAWYFMFDDLGEMELVEVETSNELVNLPENAMPAHAYINLIAQENTLLAHELADALGDLEPHTAHHTTGADRGERLKKLFKVNQLGYIKYQDPRIGQGVDVPPMQHRAVNPEKVISADGVGWN